MADVATNVAIRFRWMMVQEKTARYYFESLQMTQSIFSGNAKANLDGICALIQSHPDVEPGSVTWSIYFI